jgi:hypothetical protein
MCCAIRGYCLGRAAQGSRALFNGPPPDPRCRETWRMLSEIASLGMRLIALRHAALDRSHKADRSRLAAQREPEAP